MRTTLFVVNGPSGAGKSYLLRHVEARFAGARAVPKLTTRPRRPAEAVEAWSDLVHVTAERFRDLAPEFHYTWNGHRYGIGRADLTERLHGMRIGLIVIRDARTIGALSEGLRSFDVVPVLVSATPVTRRGRLIALGLEEREVTERLAREGRDDEDNPANADLYRWHLSNDGSVEEYHGQIRSMMAGRGAEPIGLQ